MPELEHKYPVEHPSFLSVRDQNKTSTFTGGETGKTSLNRLKKPVIFIPASYSHFCVGRRSTTASPNRGSGRGLCPPTSGHPCRAVGEVFLRAADSGGRRGCWCVQGTGPPRTRSGAAFRGRTGRGAEKIHARLWLLLAWFYSVGLFFWISVLKSTALKEVCSPLFGTDFSFWYCIWAHFIKDLLKCGCSSNKGSLSLIQSKNE